MYISESLFRTLKHNEEIAGKFREIEASILSILNFKDLCEQLLSEISGKFDIPLVWLSIVEESPIFEYISAIENSEVLKSQTKFISEPRFRRLISENLQPILANEELHRFRFLYPDHIPFQPKSVAIAPLSLDGRIVGSLNQGDTDPKRFEPGIDTTLLEHLALKLSLCLSNVTAHERLSYLAFHDPLTGLVNRSVMDRILQREYKRSCRYRTDLTVIFLDLDDFKSINDDYGHDTGDHALKYTADVLLRMKRDSDIVARFAGDEFVVILPSTEKQQAERFMTRMNSCLSTTPLIRGNSEIFIQISHGSASFSENHTDSAAGLIKKADERLYKLKNQKKSCRK
jgi:diguanylate cyclase (GGDEF)-like protein